MFRFQKKKKKNVAIISSWLKTLSCLTFGSISHLPIMAIWDTDFDN